MIGKVKTQVMIPYILILLQCSPSLDGFLSLAKMQSTMSNVFLVREVESTVQQLYHTLYVGVETIEHLIVFNKGYQFCLLNHVYTVSI
jgi:hypothetical protein